MNEKGKVLAVLGLVIALSSYVFNELFMMFFLEGAYIPEGPIPHSGPPPIGTFWLFLIPVGVVLFFLSFVFEIKDRYRRTDTDEIWN
jgi:hypothetical protein